MTVKDIQPDQETDDTRPNLAEGIKTLRYWQGKFAEIEEQRDEEEEEEAFERNQQ
jgi:hypothetical protein